MSAWLEFVRANAEQRWTPEEPAEIEAAIARYRQSPEKLSSFPFSLMVSGVLAWGPEKLGSLASQLAPLMRPALESRAPRDNKSMADLDVLSLANFIACCGYQDETALAGEWLYEVRTYRDDENVSPHWNKGFAALALGCEKLYRTMAGVAPDEAPQLASNQQFGGNIQGFLRHLAAAVEQRAGFEAVSVAWRSFIDMLGAHESARSVNRMTPFWVARIVRHQIGAAPLGDVARWLHEELAR